MNPVILKRLFVLSNGLLYVLLFRFLFGLFLEFNVPDIYYEGYFSSSPYSFLGNMASRIAIPLLLVTLVLDFLVTLDRSNVITWKMKIYAVLLPVGFAAILFFGAVFFVALGQSVDY